MFKDTVPHASAKEGREGRKRKIREKKFGDVQQQNARLADGNGDGLPPSLPPAARRFDHLKKSTSDRKANMCSRQASPKSKASTVRLAVPGD